MSLYNPSIPTGLVNLDQDYKNIKNNFTQLNTSFGVDHTPFSVTPNNGYHKTIHQIAVGSNPPSSPPGTNTIFSKTVSGDTQLFVISQGGGVSQLTGNKNASRGWQYIGGVLLQWGIFTPLPSGQNLTGNVLFTDAAGIDFTTSIYSVQLSPIVKSTVPPSSAPLNSLFPVDGTITKTGFKWIMNTGVNYFTSFYWLAIGV